MWNKRTGLSFWFSALFPLLTVSLILGSRTWGADYLWYKYQFQHALDFGMLQDQQPLFVYFNRLLRWIGLNYVGAFTVYSLIYFVATFKLFKSFGKYSKYMYAFALPAYIGFGTDIIRQTIATGLAIMVILEFNQKKYKSSAVFIVLAGMIHSASVIIVAFYLLFKFIWQKPLPVYITIPLYLILIFFFKPEWLNGLNIVFASLNLGDSKFQGYVDNSDKWFSNEGMNDIYTQGIVPLILNTGFIISIFYLGYKALEKKENKDLAIIYNMVVIGYLGLRLFFNLEILRRFFIPNTMLYPVVLGYVLFFFKYEVKEKYINEIRIINTCYILIFLWLFMYWGRFIFLYPDYKFVWN